VAQAVLQANQPTVSKLKGRESNVTSQCPDLILPLSTTTAILRPFFRDHPDEPVPEENFWTL